METETVSILRRMEARTLASSDDGRETRQIGPFLAVTHPTNDMIWLSYALLIPGSREEDVTPQVVTGLQEHFRARQRLLRFEILEPLWPWAGPRLEAIGMTLQGRMPLMICYRGDLQSIPLREGELAFLAAEAPGETLREYLMTAKVSFGESEPDVTDQEISEQRESVARRRYVCAYVSCSSGIVGVGAMSMGNDELVGVGTLPQYRRRGIAAAISSRLVGEHFAEGAEAVWLSAGDDAAASLYAKVGFRHAGFQLDYADSPG